MKGFDRHGIAARIRGLIGGQDAGDVEVCARRLGVDEVGLRMSIDDLAPNPTVDVIGAIVLTYAVDPHWLLTGDYDSSTHRTSLEDSQSVSQAITRLMMPVTSVEKDGNTLRLL